MVCSTRQVSVAARIEHLEPLSRRTHRRAGTAWSSISENTDRSLRGCTTVPDEHPASLRNLKGCNRSDICFQALVLESLLRSQVFHSSDGCLGMGRTRGDCGANSRSARTAFRERRCSERVQISIPVLVRETREANRSGRHLKPFFYESSLTLRILVSRLH